eukprot:3870804-Pleurochrysis_carterae.AAC.2
MRFPEALSLGRPDGLGDVLVDGVPWCEVDEPVVYAQRDDAFVGGARHASLEVAHDSQLSGVRLELRRARVEHAHIIVARPHRLAQTHNTRGRHARRKSRVVARLEQVSQVLVRPIHRVLLARQLDSTEVRVEKLRLRRALLAERVAAAHLRANGAQRDTQDGERGRTQSSSCLARGVRLGCVRALIEGVGRGRTE